MSLGDHHAGAGQITLLRVLFGFVPILAYAAARRAFDRLGAVTPSSATSIPPVVALGIGWILVGEPLDVI